jgi:hypothetical protein
MALTRIKLNQITQPLDQDLNVPSLSSNGDISANGSLTVSGDLTVSGESTISSNVDLNATLSVDTLTVVSSGVTTLGNIGYLGDNSGSVQYTLRSANNGTGTIDFGDSADGNIGRIQYSHASNELTLRTNDATQVTVSSSGLSVTGDLSVTERVTAKAFEATGVLANYSTDIGLAVYSGGAWLNSPASSTGYLGTGGSGVLNWKNTGVGITGDLTVSGDFTVSGNTTFIDSDNLAIEDLNIVLANGSANNTVADGAGITIDGANATLTYTSVSDQFEFNKNLKVTQNIYAVQSGQTYTDGSGGLTGIGIRNTGTSASYNAFGVQTGAGHAFQVRNNGDVRVLTSAITPKITGNGTNSALTITQKNTDIDTQSDDIDIITSGGGRNAPTGSINLTTINTSNYKSGDIGLTTGNVSGNANVGDITLTAGTSNYTGGGGVSAGSVIINAGDTVSTVNNNKQAGSVVISSGVNSANSALDGSIHLDGKVGIGTASPSAKLHVDDQDNEVAIFNRTGAVGDIVSFHESGVYAGSIGSKNDNLTIGSGTAGIIFNNDVNQIYSWNMTTGAASSGAIDIGASTSKFKDGWFNGTVNAGTLDAVGDINAQASFRTDEVRHDVRPSLLLDFANQKILDSRVSFTRSSTATYWDGKTTAKAEQNLVSYSQDFTNSVWIKNNATITANSETAPDGTTTATLLTSTSTNETGVFDSTQFSGTCVTSCYVKQGTGQYFIINTHYSAGIQRRVWFDLSSGTVANTESNVTGTITDVGNGWYRCTATTDSPNRQTFFVGNASTSYSSAVGLTYYIWGAQVEQRSSATAYTATTSTPITLYQPVLQTASVDKPRFDHDPVTRKSKGLLIEEARTNILAKSSKFNDSAWDASGINILTDYGIAPDGTHTADAMIATDVNSGHFMLQNQSVTAGVTYTQSMYVKKIGSHHIFQYAPSTGFSQTHVNYDLNDGSVSNSSLGSMEYVGNGWWRCTITVPATVSTNGRIAFASYNVDGAGRLGTYTGNGYDGVLIWGAQLEVGNFATSYIPTDTVQVTRSTELAYIPESKIDFDATEGTLFTQSTIPTLNNGQRYVAMLGTSTYYGGLGLFYNGGTSIIGTAWGRSNCGSVAVSSTTQTAYNSLVWQQGYGYTMSVNGTDTNTIRSYNQDAGYDNTPKSLYIGSTSGGVNVLCGHIQKIAVYPSLMNSAIRKAMTEE